MKDSILVERTASEYDVNIIIGENGSGKSYYLNSIAKEFIDSGMNVIGIATSVHDKFNIRSRRFHFFGGRQGRNMVEKLVKKSLYFKDSVDTDRVRYLVRALEYSGYEARIGIKVEGYDPENEKLIKHDLTMSDEDKNEILTIISNYGENFGHLDLPGFSELLSLNLIGLTAGNIYGTTLSTILKHERILKKLKIISSVNLYLEKEYSTVELKNASSGELMMMSSFLHISSHITGDSVIIIDEPENSLHPKWQKEYISKILDLFYLYKPKIIIASHSPLIIPLENQDSKLFRLSEYKLEEISRESSNNEEVMSEVFGVLTPENRYLSDYLINVINDYDANLIDYKDARDKVLEQKQKIYDVRQREFVDGVLEIIEVMSDIKGGDGG
ncbi:MAG: AAA family ATPase [Saccharospirillum sp.]|uniref:AAA family ATPase n=2 Tax=Saccharospirillum sp. TaxID=2033801 RepID=UPI00329792B8